MATIRSKGMPTPKYDPTSSSLTLTLYYNGEMESDCYVGGRVRKVDYADIETLNFEYISEFLKDEIPQDTKKLIYTPLMSGHRLIETVDDLRKYGRNCLGILWNFRLFIVTVGDENDIGDGNNGSDLERNVGNDQPIETGEEGNAEGLVEDNNPCDKSLGQPIENKESEFFGPIDYSKPLGTLSENDFFRRVDNSDEWIAEYTRRFGKGETDKPVRTENVQEEGFVDFSDRDDDDFCVNDDDDISLVDEVYEELVEQADLVREPAYTVKKSVENGSSYEFLGFDETVSDSGTSGEKEFDEKISDSGSSDDQQFDDNVSENAEIGEKDNSENEDVMSDERYVCENVVGCENDGLDLHRVSDDEEEELESLKQFNESTIFDPVIDLGHTFRSKEIFKKTVDSYAVKIRRTLPCSRSDSRRVYVRCSERGMGCPFKINTVKVMNTTPDNEEAWVIRELCLEHTCEEGWYMNNVTVKWLADRFISWFKTDAKRDVKGFRADVEKKLNIEVSMSKAYRAKNLALDKLQGDPDLQYTKLWEYANELRTTNPGSTIILGTDNVDDQTRFSKFYVCFYAMKSGFQHCRPIIGVDGCHLKGPHGGILLTVVGVDPDNGNYPIAYAVVSVENKENWRWFFSVLKTDLGLQNGLGFTFVSDKQKGLIHALPEIFPAAEHRFCVRHLVVNMIQAGNRGIVLKNAVWRAANAYTVAEFKSAMKNIRDKFPEAAEWLKDKHLSEWSKSHFMEHCKCDMNLNNCCESFNSYILEARNKPIITMLEWIREYLMKKWHLNRETADKWDGPLCPTISLIVQNNGKEVGGCRPIKASRTNFQIQCSDGGQYAVDLSAKTCSCRSWQVTGIPCIHSLSAINHDRLQIHEFVDDYYKVSSFRAAYAGIVMPISGENVWGTTIFIPPLPPNFGRRSGRPARLRRRGIDEDKNGKKKKRKGPVIRKLRRFQTTIHCGHCGGPGHNALFCTQLPESAKAKRDNLFKRAFASGPGETSTAQKEMLPPTNALEEQQAVSEPVLSDVPSYSLATEPTQPGPSMFEQLNIGNTDNIPPTQMQAISIQDIQQAAIADLKRSLKKTHSRRVKMRIPPRFTSEDDLVQSQQSESGPVTSKDIVVEGGKKYLHLS